ncbi:ribosomal L1 domain-containing protein 1-like [Dendrobium catenatum]|uniref:60S ribosomal protein L10a-2 n=1 Tax=Dendrobium catenatum TaxID=906689 RepID=A0A2I0VNZ3_9ASPA|nr:ribosomal L1 domain-containing protein 1-like [Dendrobium catenatum]PKU65131.1 60S ribosomal protein L10a-2 [Dendrobium catenatum]
MSPSSTPGSSRIIREDAGRAVDALLGFLRARAKQSKAQLFEHDDFLYLHLSVRRFPSTSRLNPYRIPLPHSLHPLDPSRTSLCLIADDSLAETARSTAAAEKLPFDSVIPLSELRTDYVPFESRRRLCDSYDIFFAERRIITLLPRFIGNYFFKKKKIPLAVNISRPGWPEAVRQACRSTLLFLSSGTGIGMKVGRVSMDREEIIDNLMAAIEGAVNHVPKKWANIRCMYIKAVQSVALPIYQVVPEMGMKIEVGSRDKAQPLDGMVVQERDGKSGAKKEKSRKKRVGSKKGRGRIHDVDYVGGELVDCIEDENEEVADEQENDELGMEKKKKKKDGKGKLIKGKKRRTAAIDKDEGEEKESGDQFIELDTGRKMRKRAKKIVNSEVEEHDINDGLTVDAIVTAVEVDHGDKKELLLKKKMKSKGKKGKKVSLHGSNEDQENVGADGEANVKNVDAAIATSVGDDDDDDHVDVHISNVKKSAKNNEKIGKERKVRKAKKTKLRH